MRLFTGISLPYEVRRNIELLLQHLQPLAPLQWSPSENLHITTKFIGDCSAGQLPAIEQALASLPKPAPFHLTLSGLGWFPNPHHPRAFFAAVRPDPALAQLAAATDAALVPAGVASETRPYQPHLTLARIQHEANLLPLRQAIAALPSVDFGRLDVRKFHLYESKAGSVYSVLSEFPL